MDIIAVKMLNVDQYVIFFTTTSDKESQFKRYQKDEKQVPEQEKSTLRSKSTFTEGEKKYE